MSLRICREEMLLQLLPPTLWVIVWIVLLLSGQLKGADATGPKGLLDGLGLDSAVSKQELSYTCDPLPPAKPPAQMSGGEGVPPLPLPAVPLRRTEKKNPPRPPVLVVKVDSGRGQGDWNTNPQDVENLLRWMAKNLGVSFSSQVRTLDDVLGLRPAPTERASKEGR